jgi:hypothetical protein
MAVRQRPRAGHFTEEEWADLARRQGGSEQQARLERHLLDGCEPCAKTLGIWAAVADWAGQEGSYQPPDEVVSQAKGHFHRHRPKGLLERAARRVSLVFDTFRQPLPAGVRTAGPSPRQLLYKAGRYLVRLQIEPEDTSDRLLIVGQVVDEEHPQSALQDLPVLLMGVDKTVDRTVTNKLGEFQLESKDPSESLRLSISIPEIGTLALPGQLIARQTGHGTRGLGMLDGSGRRTKARHA